MQADHLVPLEVQVGGHAGGVLATEDGSRIVKSSNAKERAFYELIAKDSQLAPLRNYVPQFLGTMPGTPGAQDSEDE